MRFTIAFLVFSSAPHLVQSLPTPQTMIRIPSDSSIVDNPTLYVPQPMDKKPVKSILKITPAAVKQGPKPAITLLSQRSKPSTDHGKPARAKQPKKSMFEAVDASLQSNPTTPPKDSIKKQSAPAVSKRPKRVKSSASGGSTVTFKNDQLTDDAALSNIFKAPATGKIIPPKRVTFGEGSVYLVEKFKKTRPFFNEHDVAASFNALVAPLKSLYNSAKSTIARNGAAGRLAVAI